MKSRTEGPSLSDIPEPNWVTEMHEHFHKTGKYRQGDLDQVLGKPWETVKVDSSGNLELACRPLGGMKAKVKK